jgi:hypothetical protein
MTKTTDPAAAPGVLRPLLNMLACRGDLVLRGRLLIACARFKHLALFESTAARASQPHSPVSLPMVLAGLALLLASGVAGAFTAPAAGDFGYDVYDIVVNQILNGPIGFIGGVALIVFGATQIMKNWFSTILCIIAGTVLIRADSLVVTLGALVG